MLRRLLDVIRQPAVLQDTSTRALRSHLATSHPRPVVLPGLVRQWDALQDWIPENAYGRLRSLAAAERNVEVELVRRGRGYLDASWSRVSMPLNLFIDAFMLNRIPSSGASDLIGYLAQQSLFETIPELDEQAPALEHALVCGPHEQLERRNMWLGPSGTFSPIHRDHHHNLFVQVSGTKRVSLFSPEQQGNLYLSASGPHANTSRIPVAPEHLEDAQEWPLLETALRDDKTRAVELGPGNTLLIPQGWYHCVEAVGEHASVSVNHWFR